MSAPARTRLVRIELEGNASAAEGALLVRGDAHPFALAGDWAGGGAIVGSEPVALATPEDDPFSLLDAQPEIEGEPEGVGGGWFGYLGYNLGARLEPVPPPPPRRVPLPDFALAFYDHVLRLDREGRWWFEALWTDERADALNARLNLLRTRLAEGVRERPVWVGIFRPAPPGGAGHRTAIDECRERIAAGEIFQANLCLRLEAEWKGDPLDLFARTAGTLEPRHAGLIAGPWGAVCSLSPELFLRRRGREVMTEPIKGTAPRVLAAGREATRADDNRAALEASAKDRAENVMIVDLMRNDLGRVCEYGSVEVSALNEPRAAPGVWHLVSTVRGTLREDAADADLLRASFPPGSVTGAPKIQAMRVIAELEAGGREADTGAVGFASPVAGLGLNVGVRAPVPALAGDADRPDPESGVFETTLVRGGVAVDARAHLARLERSLHALYGAELPSDLRERVAAAAAAAPLQRLRVVAAAHECTVNAEPLDSEPAPEPVTVAPALLPGGLGAHKWHDRRLVDELAARLDAVPLLVDLDGDVLEAAYANVFIVEGTHLITPPLDGRQLPGTVRARVLALHPAREERITLDRVAGADELLLASSIRGINPAQLVDGPEPRFQLGARLRAALREDSLGVMAR